MTAPTAMDDAEFWTLIDLTRPEPTDPTLHADRLADSLEKRGLESTLAYAEAFDAAMAALYTWDLWGAAYLALGGCGDDSFEYLRAWMIGEGRAMWESARRDPEQTFIDLLAGDTDPEDRWVALGLHDGEAVLYAAGVAHERITGEWRSATAAMPAEPAGEAWDEDDLPSRFSRLTAALPSDWWTASADVPSGGDPILDDVVAGLDAFGSGDHASGSELLDPLIADPISWNQIVGLGLASDVAYVVGINRLIAGDPLGARAALARADSDDDHIRRARAQVELTTGDLDAASRLLDTASDANLLDRALGSVLAHRRGDAAEAIDGAARLVNDIDTEAGHPWDLAGVLFQIGHVLAERGVDEMAARAAEVIHELIETAPADLPLRSQVVLLDAAVARLRGRPDDARSILEANLDTFGGADRGLALVELARAQLAAGSAAEADQTFEQAMRAFELSGERWLADAVNRERDDLDQ